MHWLLLFPGCKDRTPHDSDTEPVAVDFPCPEVQAPTLDGATWTLAADAPGGDILSFVEGSDGLLFAVSTMNGAYRSEDGGLTWSAVQVEISHGAGQGVIDRNGIIYLIVGLGELFQSGDGHSFRPVEALREQGIHGLVEQGDTLFAIDEQAAVWKGSGEIWTEVGQVPVPPGPPHGNEDNKFYPSEDWWYLGSTGSRLFALEQGGGLWFSDDEAQSWEQAEVSGPFEVTSFGVHGQQVAAWSPEGRLVLSENGGQDFEVIETGSVLLNGLGWWKDELFLVGSQGLFQVSDGGLVSKATLDESRLHEAFAVHGTAERLLIGHKDGILSTEDLKSFAAAQGLITRDLGPLITHPICPSLVWVGTQCERGLFFSADWGDSLARVDEYLHYVMVPQVSLAEPGTLWVTSDDTLLRTENLGGSWEYILRDTLQWHLHGLGLHPTDADVAFIGTVGSGEFEDPNGMRVLRTQDGGVSFQDVSTGLPTGDAASAHGIHVMRADPDIVLMGSFRGGDFTHTSDLPGVGLFRSTDGGDSWKSVGPDVGDVPVITECEGVLFAASDGGLLRSEDKGATWDIVHPGDFLGVACDQDEVLTVGYDDLYRSQDGGDTWSAWFTGLESVQGHTRQMPQVAISADGQVAYVALPTGGLFRRPL